MSDRYEMGGMFHVHPLGTDEHALAEGAELNSVIKERLGIDVVYGGVHYKDPGHPEVGVDIEESIRSMEEAGIHLGIEFNIVKTDRGWRLDISPEELEALKIQHPGIIAIASIHAVKAFGFSKEEDSEQAPEQTADSMLKAYEEILSKYGRGLDVLGHPFGYVTSDVTLAHVSHLAELASRNGVALEVNIANTGLYRLEDGEFVPSVRQVAEWNPVLRFAEVIQHADTLLVIGGDFHGNSPLERKILEGQLTRKDSFQDSRLTYQALRLAASLRAYFRKYEIAEERIVNCWNTQQVFNWATRAVQN